MFKNLLSERIILSAMIAGLLGYAVFAAFDFAPAARLLPLVFGIPTLMLSLVTLGVEIQGQRTGNVRRGTSSESLHAAGPATPRQQREWRSRELRIIGWLLGLLALVVLVGFIWALPAFLVLFLRISGRQRWPVVAGVAIGVFLVIYGLFSLALRLPLYPGLFPLGLIG
jgi:Tripartite tricarboxylate transporter TctB family